MPGVFYCDPQHMRTCLQLCSHLHDPRSLRTFLVPLNLWCLLYSIRSGRPRRKLGLFSRKPWLGISEENSLGSRGTRTRRAAARERERERATLAASNLLLDAVAAVPSRPLPTRVPLLHMIPSSTIMLPCAQSICLLALAGGSSLRTFADRCGPHIRSMFFYT